MNDDELMKAFVRAGYASNSLGEEDPSSELTLALLEDENSIKDRLGLKTRYRL